MASVSIENYPAWANPRQWLNLGVVNAARRPSIDNKKTIVYQKRSDVNPNDIIGRGGVVAIDGTSTAIDNSKRFMWFKGNDLIGPLQSLGWAGTVESPQQATESMGRACADLFPLYAFEGYEFAQEGSAVDRGAVGTQYDDHIFAQAFYQRRLEKYQGAGRSFFNFGGNYGASNMYNWPQSRGFKVSGVEKVPTDAVFRNLYSSPRSSCSYFTSGKDAVYNANVRWYPTQAQYARDFYTVGHAMEIMKKGALASSRNDVKVGFHGWPLLEQVDGVHTLHNGHYYERRIASPAGIVKTGEHPVVDFDFYVAMCLFWGYMVGDGVLAWDNPELFGSNPSLMTPLNDPPSPDRAALVAWIPDTPGTPAPAAGQIRDGYPELPIVHQDAVFVAEQLKQSMYLTEGVAFEHIPYTVTAQQLSPSSNWTTTNISRTVQSDGSTLLFDAAANDGYWSATGRRGRGVNMGRVKTSGSNTWFSGAYFDPSLRKGQREKIRITIAGTTLDPIVVTGGKVTVYNGTR